MNPLRRALSDYLVMRRALGYKLERDGKLLAQLVTFLEEADEVELTTRRALAWAMLPPPGDGSWWSHRLCIVRGFASYLQTIGLAAEVPPTDLLPWRPCRATPYLYSDQEVEALMSAAGKLRTPLRVATYQTLIGLLSVTGMRVGEAVRLDQDHLNLEHGTLTIWRSKLDKSRELPLHATTTNALHAYLRRSDRRQIAEIPALFVSTAGTRLLYCNIHWTFRRLVALTGLKRRSATCRPRLHDLRHSFAVRTLIDSYREDADIGNRLARLSTYLGHVNPNATYWYLSASPELLQIASDRRDRFYESGGLK